MKGKPLELINYLSQQNRDKIFEVKEVNGNRTQSQNAIAWALITLIANELRKSKEEVYLDMLKDYGQSMLIPVPKGTKPIFKYSIYKSSSILNGKEADWYLILKGSSEFDTKEMSIFIDGIVQECNNIGIPVEVK